MNEIGFSRIYSNKKIITRVTIRYLLKNTHIKSVSRNALTTMRIARQHCKHTTKERCYRENHGVCDGVHFKIEPRAQTKHSLGTCNLYALYLTFVLVLLD